VLLLTPYPTLRRAWGQQVTEERIDPQVSMRANNHPAMFLHIKFVTDGSLPAGLPVKISVDALAEV
jgi:hypothetical protein